MTPHTGCMIVLLNYINVFFLPPLHILFESNDCVSASSLPPAVILVRSLITAGAVLSYTVPLPRLYNLLNHPAVINKLITHFQFLHIALFTVYISFDAIVFALAPVCLYLLHTQNRRIIIRFTKHCVAAKRQDFSH